MKILVSVLTCFIFLASIATGQTNPGETISNAIVLSGALPLNATGTTVGYQNNYNENCPYASYAPDVVYSYTPAGNIIADIDLCGSEYDTKVYIYQNTYTPGAPIACNDDYYDDDVCGFFTSLITGIELTGGNTYYIVIDGYDYEEGDYMLEVRETPSCIWGADISCPTGAVLESEQCGDNDNGGCNMDLGFQVWEDVPASGGTFCGTTWAGSLFRDSDWFELILTQASIVSITADAEVEILFGLVSGGTAGYGGNPDCDGISGIMPFELAGPCNESTLGLGVLNPGTYWFIARMDTYLAFPCDNNYWIDFQVTPVTCIPPVSLLADNITPTTANLSWTPADSESSWQYVCGPSPLPVPTGSGTSTSSSSTNPISGLTPDMFYQFYVRADCGGEDYSIWAGPYTFSTPQIPATLPFIETFESGTDSWQIVNGTENNKWMAGSATFHGGNGSVYISNNGGASNTYSLTSSSVVHLYRDISFAGGTDGYILKFWWKGMGEGASDRMKVYLADPSATIVAGSQVTSGQIGAYNLSGTWTEETLNLPAGLTGYTKRLVFSWVNDNSDGVQPPVAIDDISIVAFVCGNFPVPYYQSFDGVTAPAIPLCWTVADDNSDGVAWITSSSTPNSAPNSIRIGSNSALAMNDWFFSPAINLVTGNYLVIFKYRGSGPSDPEKLEVKWGTAPQASSMTNGVIFNNNNIVNTSYQDGAGLLAVSAPGDYHIGWHGYSNADMAYLLVDDIQIMSNIFTWTGNISTDWTNPGNWSSGVVPNQFVIVEIPASPGSGRFPSVGAGITANCLEINLADGASIIVLATGILNVINP